MQIKRDIEKYAKDYSNSDFETILVIYRRRKLLEILNKYKPKKILEIGCGLDSIFNYYNEFEEFTIVEPSKDFCKTAKNSERFNSKIEIINGFLEEKFKECSKKNYDFIIASCLLHEVSDPNIFLNVIKNLSSSKAFIHISVPNSKSFHLIWAYESGIIPSIGIKTNRAQLLQQNTTYDIDSLKEKVSKCGFVIKEFGSYFIKPFDHKKMQLLFNEKIIDENLLDGLYKINKYMPDYGAEIFVNCEVIN